MAHHESPPPAAPARHALSRELSDLLIEFSIALNKHAMYPEGHPSLEPAVERVLERLDPLFASRASLSLGVARHQLVIEGVATDLKNPVLADLASRLHRHHLGAVTLRRGLGPEELHEALTVLAVEADRTDRPLGLGPSETLTRWEHLRLYPVTYERLTLVDGGGAADMEPQEGRTRAAQLWLGLARAAMAAEAAEERPPEDPVAVAHAIQQHARSSAYDQVIVGYMLQIAEEVRTPGRRESAELRHRISRLVSNLDSDTLATLLEMGGDRAQRRQFLLSASEGMAVDAVVELVQAAGRTEQGQTVSTSMLRMLQKLAQHADRGVGTRRAAADTAVREQVADMIRGWALHDPNPKEYRKALDGMARTPGVFATGPAARHRAEPERLVEMALETGAVGSIPYRAVDMLVDAGRLGWIIDRLQSAPAGQAAAALWERLATADMLTRVVTAEPLDVPALDALLGRLGAAAAEPLLDLLATAASAQTRRALLDRAVALGPAVGLACLARLADERWYVQRNLLRILGSLPEFPEGFQPERHLRHDDARVRFEAVRVLLGHPTKRERAVAVAVGDPDPRIGLLGLTAAVAACPESAIPMVAARARSEANPDLQVLAIRALGASGSPAAVAVLVAIARPRRGLLGLKPPPKSAAYLAALQALAPHADHPEVRQAVAAAAASRDPEIARAAGGGKTP